MSEIDQDERHGLVVVVNRAIDGTIPLTAQKVEIRPGQIIINTANGGAIFPTDDTSLTVQIQGERRG